MKTIRVYSSRPENTPLACAFQGLRRAGVRVILQPLTALPPAPQPGLRRHALHAERLNMQLRLAVIGDQLGYIEDGLVRPELGVEQGLRAERDALLSRVQAITATLGGPGGAGEPAG